MKDKAELQQRLSDLQGKYDRLKVTHGITLRDLEHCRQTLLWLQDREHERADELSRAVKHEPTPDVENGES